MKNKFSILAMLASILCIPQIAAAQEVVAKTADANSGLQAISLHTILILIAIFMLLPIYVTGQTFLLAAKVYLQKVKGSAETAKKAGVIILILTSSHFAEASNLGFNNGPERTDWLTWILLAVIAIEFIIFFFFSQQIGKFLNKEVEPDSYLAESSTIIEKSWLEGFWDKINSFKPLSEEANIDTGHSYDGIRELDNVTPPWFLAGFALSIVFGIVYLFQRHLTHTIPSQLEEFKVELAEADSAKAKYLATQGEKVDETNIKLLGAADIAAGKAVFLQNCIACHGPHGGSMPGGVGPNLTDEYWIHGGSIQDIFKTIKYGWPEKGMISWKDQLSPKQIGQLASYIISLKGSNPAGAKEPQGDLFKEIATLNLDSMSTTKDSALVQK
jgi:cytochrome c oxidase cbb3-type subunit 3